LRLEGCERGWSLDFEAKLNAFYDRLDLNGATVIDVGAHVGRHTLPLARKIGPTGVLHAFEPIPQIRHTLVANLNDARLQNVIVYPFALARSSSIAEFNYIPNLPEESGLKRRHVYNGIPAEAERFQVGVHSLDRFFSPDSRIDFVKIDVEGGELDVLRGASHIISSRRAVIAFECGAASFLGYHELPNEIFEIFRRSEYLVYSIIGNQIQNVDEFRAATFAQNFWDYVALPSEKAHLASLLVAT
jgi:FkbM family methyltransferase